MFRKTVLFTGIFFFLFSATSAFALRSSDVEKYLTSMKDLTPYFDAMDDIHDPVESGPSDFSEFSLQQLQSRFLETIGGDKKFESIVTKHGFSSASQWVDIASQVIQAFIVTEMNSAGGITELQAQYDSMKSDPDTPPEMLTMLEQMLTQVGQEIKKFTDSVPPAHIEVVTPYLPQIRKVLDN